MSNLISGTVFDGETLKPHPITLEVGELRLINLTGEITINVAIADIRVSDRLAALPRYLYLPENRTIETTDHGAIDILLAGQKRGRLIAAVHWLEARSRVAAAATLLLAGMVAATIFWGLPRAARDAAMAVPASIETQAGETALLTIKRILAPSQLNLADRTRVQNQVDRLVKAGGLSVSPRLVFRSMGGQFPNAFALPGGFIVISAELVTLATDDEELAAVVAHEIGHWQRRHGLQSVLRNSTALLVVSSVTGDLSTLTTFAGTIPFVLLQRGYSREFEEEADAYAVDLLRKTGIDVVFFETILKKLENSRPPAGQDLTYLSTHPSTTDRIRRLRSNGATTQLTLPPTPPLAKGDAPGIALEPIHGGEPNRSSPRALRQAQPAYPPGMAASRTTGKVKIEFVIDKNGDSRAPRIVQSSHHDFEATTLAAVKQWKFSPGRQHGQNVATLVSIDVEYNLDDQDSNIKEEEANPTPALELPETSPPLQPTP